MLAAYVIGVASFAYFVRHFTAEHQRARHKALRMIAEGGE